MSNSTVEKVSLLFPKPDVPNVGTEELKNYIRSVIEARQDGTPLLIWGAPGIGKTAIVNLIGEKEYQIPVVDYDLMTMSPEDFFLPAITGKDEIGSITSNSKSTRLPDEFLPVYRKGDKEGEKKANGKDGKGGVLFFDEIARCNPRVQNVCLKLINERHVGEWYLGSEWVIIAAANREGDDEADFRFTTTLGNRFTHVNFAPTFEEWCSWAAHPETKDRHGDPLIPSDVIAFLKFHHDKYFYNLMPSEKQTAWPSPRSWTNAGKALHQREKLHKKLSNGKRLTVKEKENIVSSVVGKDAGSSFIGFLQLMNKIDVNDIKKIYTAPKTAPSIKKLNMDEKNAFIASVVYSKKNVAISHEEMKNFTDWMIDQKEANMTPYIIKMVAMLQEIHPELKKDDFWEENCKADLFEAYDTLTRTK